MNDAGDKKGIQAIHEAASSDHLHCLQFLLKKGGKVSAEDHGGKTPLHKVPIELASSLI